MSEMIQAGNIQVAAELYNFINDEALPGTGLDQDKFWASVDEIVNDLGPRNRELLEKRETLQSQIDAWHTANRDKEFDPAAYRAFLEEIGYLLPEGDAFAITTENVDPEVATLAGPQLVVPVDNARYALNAANARGGSLYDALYGTDAISDEGGAARGGAFNPARAAKVVEWARAFLDEAAPLAAGSHGDAAGYAVADGALVVSLVDGATTGLADAAQCRGHQGDAAAPAGVLLRNHGLHIELRIDRGHAIGEDDPAVLHMEIKFVECMDATGFAETAIEIGERCLEKHLRVHGEDHEGTIYLVEALRRIKERSGASQGG